MTGLEVLVAAATPERTRRLAEPLRQAGHHVAVEADPQVVAKGLADGVPDVVVVDMRLPGLDRGALRQALSSNGEDAPPESLEEVERRHIQVALRHTGGNKRRAAILLGIARSTLIQKVRKHGLEAPRDRS